MDDHVPYQPEIRDADGRVTMEAKKDVYGYAVRAVLAEIYTDPYEAFERLDACWREIGAAAMQGVIQREPERFGKLVDGGEAVLHEELTLRGAELLVFADVAFACYCEPWDDEEAESDAIMDDLMRPFFEAKKGPFPNSQTRKLRRELSRKLAGPPQDAK